jgi:hypothetical protein
MYQFIPEILEFKNAEGRMMILYDFEERLSVSIAGTARIQYISLLCCFQLMMSHEQETGLRKGLKISQFSLVSGLTFSRINHFI